MALQRATRDIGVRRGGCILVNLLVVAAAPACCTFLSSVRSCSGREVQSSSSRSHAWRLARVKVKLSSSFWPGRGESMLELDLDRGDAKLRQLELRRSRARRGEGSW